MPKADFVPFQGVVTECLPNAHFRVKLENGHTVLGTISGKIRLNNIRIGLGDKVTIEFSPYNMDKGIITFREKGYQANVSFN